VDTTRLHWISSGFRWTFTRYWLNLRLFEKFQQKSTGIPPDKLESSQSCRGLLSTVFCSQLLVQVRASSPLKCSSFSINNPHLPTCSSIYLRRQVRQRMCPMRLVPATREFMEWFK
jgi:hypothetical protein